MTRVALTGAGGFLGWHTRAALQEQGAEVVIVAMGDGFDLSSATSAVTGADRLIHIAGVNRAHDDDVRETNVLFAEQLAAALARSEQPPHSLAYANSTQSGNGTTYGEAKARSGDVLSRAASAVGSTYVDLRLPNLFGEHGRPFYNAVTATFSHLLAAGEQPAVLEDKLLTLLHAQDAADLLIGSTGAEALNGLAVEETVSGLLGRLSEQAATYRSGEIPDVQNKFERDLFNTYRSYVVDLLPIRLTKHSDSRGSFFEIVRSHGGTAQTSFSTTEPGVSRGDHFHRRKIERFTVLSGTATISLRRLFSAEVLEFAVTGSRPVAVDMPTMWTHRIENTGAEVLYTAFWTNALFDSSDPDTIAELVLP